ncbi:6555_t:CDS:2, partial [Gigaspora margarita]
MSGIKEKRLLIKLVNNDFTFNMELDSDLTLPKVYDHIVAKFPHNHKDPRYEYFFVYHDEDVGPITVSPRNKLLNCNKKMSNIVNNNKISIKRMLPLMLDDGKSVRNFVSNNELSDKLSKIRKELIENLLVQQYFNFLDSETFQEISLKSEEVIKLETVLKNSNVIYISLEEKMDHISSTHSSSDEEISHNPIVNDKIPQYEPCVPYHGLILAREGIKLGKYRSFDYVQSVKFSIIEDQNKFIAKGSICKRMNDLFFMKNQINLTSEDDLPLEWHALLDYDYSIIHPLFNFNEEKCACFTVVNQKIKLDLRKDLIKPSKEFKKVVEKVIEGTEPYLNLMNIFSNFGNFFAQQILLGLKVSKYVKKNNIKDYERIKENSVEWTTFDDFKKISNKLKNMLMYIDENGDNYFFTPKNEKIEQDKLDSWVKSCYQDEVELQVIGYRDLIAIYEIFDEPIRGKIKSILGIHERKALLSKSIYSNHLQLSDVKQEILMTGSEQVDAS